MIKAIILDCFGVIITDSLSQMHAELHLRDAEAAIELRDIIRAANQGMISVEESRTKAAELFGLSVSDYAAQVRNGEVRDEQLLGYITELHQTYKTALLSNIGKGSLLIRFTQQELDTYFDTVVASGDVGIAKPDPRVYQLTAARLAVEPQDCIFTDDRPEFCAAAETIGMHGLLYRNFAQFKTDLDFAISRS